MAPGVVGAKGDNSGCPRLRKLMLLTRREVGGEEDPAVAAVDQLGEELAGEYT